MLVPLFFYGLAIGVVGFTVQFQRWFEARLSDEQRIGYELLNRRQTLWLFMTPAILTAIFCGVFFSIW